MARLIPRSLLEGRSSLGKQLTKNRFYERSKKSLLIAVLWFIFGGFFAAHRFYLGRWKSAFLLVILIWAVNILSASYSGGLKLHYLLWVIFAIELIFVPFLTKLTNEKIQQDLDIQVF